MMHCDSASLRVGARVADVIGPLDVGDDGDDDDDEEEEEDEELVEVAESLLVTLVLNISLKLGSLVKIANS